MKHFKFLTNFTLFFLLNLFLHTIANAAIDSEVLGTDIINKLSDSTEDAKNGKDLLIENQKEAFLKYQKAIHDIFYDKSSNDNLLDASINNTIQSLQNK